MEDRDTVFVDEYGRINGAALASTLDTPTRTPQGLVKRVLSTIHGFVFGDSAMQGRENPYVSVSGGHKAVLVDQYGLTPGQSSFTGHESIHKTVAGTDKIFPVYFVPPGSGLNDYRTAPGVRKVRVPASDGTFPNSKLFYWPLASGGAVDLKEYAHGALTLTNSGVTRRAGPSALLPDAADFTSADSDNLSVADAAGFAPGSAYTMGAWFLVDALGQNCIMSQFNNSAGNRGPEINVEVTTNVMRFIGTTDGLVGTVFTFSTTATVSTGTWYRFIAAWDGTEVHLYVNGTLDSSHTFAGPLYNSAATLAIGTRAEGGGNSLDGGIQGAFIMANRCMTAAEVAWDYNDGDGQNLIAAV